jgi:hypothetical protein
VRVFLLGSPTNRAHLPLVYAWTGLGLDVSLNTAADLRVGLDGADVAIGRLDVLPTLDGVEPGLFGLRGSSAPASASSTARAVCSARTTSC